MLHSSSCHRPGSGSLAGVVLLALLAAGCGEEVISVNYDAACEGLNPHYCLLPWPSDRWLSDDPSTETGFRLDYSASAIPRNKNFICKRCKRSLPSA